MTIQEWDAVKLAFKRLHEVHSELWLEKQLLRNLIIDSRWTTETELDLALERGKRHPQNIRQAKENFASEEEARARLGLDDWLAAFEKDFPRSS